jgi:hypothetical protein
LIKKLKFIDRNGPIIAHAEDANSLMHITQDYNEMARVVLCGVLQACQSFLCFQNKIPYLFAALAEISFYLHLYE